MAGVNYEVNIQLNAKTLDKQLGDLEKRVNNLKKNLAAPLRTEERAAKQAAASAKERARLEDRAAAAQVTRVNLGQRLNRLEEKGLDVTKGRTIINRSLKAYEEGRIQTARAQNSLARTYITQLERQLKVGVKTGRMQAENIDALSKAQVKRYTLDQQIRRLEEAGLNTDKLRAKLGEVTTAQARRQFGSFKQLTNELSLAIRKERDRLELQKRQTREIERQARIGGPRSPIGGRANISGSPAALAASGKARSQRLQGVALGAGFPLLFGGGPGAILGGAAGGLVGGPAGFAAQIALSAIGQQFDKLGAAALDLGKALNPLTFDLKTVAGATGIAGTKTEEFLAKIEEFGGKAAAAAEASKLMAVRIGKDATDALTKFGKDAQTVGNQISIIFTKVLAAIAAAAGPLLASLGAGLTRINQLGGFKERTGLSGADLVAQQFLTRTGRLQPKQRQRYAVGLGLEATATAGQIRKAAEARAATSQQSFETQQATALEQKAVRLEAEAEAAKQPKKKGRRSRLPDLQAEEKKLQDLLRLDRTMFELRRNDDALGIRRLEHQMRLVEFAEEKAKVQASDVPNAEKLQSIANIDLEIKREELQLAYDIDEINKKTSQRAFEEMQNKIKQQNQLNKGLQQQLQLAEQVSNVLGQGMTQSFELLITGAENWGMALRDIAANVLRDIARQLIQIYVIEQAVSFMRTLFSATSLTAPGGRYEGQAGALAAKPPPLPPLPGKALGGAVSSGKPYMVGERGPELFVPGASGNIVPNHAMGGVEVGSINITVENTGEQLSPAAQKQIANQVQGIVMSTLVNERRSGGVLR